MKPFQRFVVASISAATYLAPNLAHSQQCSLSGKHIEYRIRICSERKCQRIRDNLVFVGTDRILRFDENPNTGVVFYLGRTVEYTEKDLPIARETIAEAGGGGTAKISASATLNGNTLRLRQSDTYSFSARMINSYWDSGIQLNNCSACSVTHWDMTHPGFGAMHLVSQLSCEVTNARQ